jgi:hypothetical protein
MRVYVEDTWVMNAGDLFLDNAGGIAIEDQTILHLRGNSSDRRQHGRRGRRRVLRQWRGSTA